jgi:hypothetical protein
MAGPKYVIIRRGNMAYENLLRAFIEKQLAKFQRR